MDQEKTMSDERADHFDWGELGEKWWRETGAQCKASELQIRFACAKHAGATATGAARLAGYTDSEEDKSAIRQSGYKAIRTTAVQNMLALADAEGKPTTAKVMDKAARVEHLSAIANKSPDPTLKIRAIEALNKMDERDTELGRATDQDGFSEWRVVRDHLQLPGGAVAILSLWTGLERCLSNLPLLHDVHEAVMRDAPDMWSRVVSRSSFAERTWLNQHLANPKWQLEARVQLWREVGVEIDAKKTLDLSQLVQPIGQDGNQSTQTGVTA
jgi:hypothetical protein